MRNYFNLKSFLSFGLLIIIISGFYFNPDKVYAVCSSDDAPDEDGTIYAMINHKPALFSSQSGLPWSGGASGAILQTNTNYNIRNFHVSTIFDCDADPTLSTQLSATGDDNYRFKLSLRDASNNLLDLTNWDIVSASSGSKISENGAKYRTYTNAGSAPWLFEGNIKFYKPLSNVHFKLLLQHYDGVWQSVAGITSAPFNVEVGTPPTNGVCATTHYNCVSGTSANNIDGPTEWTWNCNGLNGGTSVACSEAKSLLLPPPTPGNLRATPGSCGTGRINVSWDSSVGATSYTLKDLNIGLPDTIYSGSAISFAHVGLVESSIHSYVISASNAFGTSLLSSPPVYAIAPPKCEGDLLPDLTAGSAWPLTATTGVSQVFQSNIMNIGDVPTGASFSNFFQISNAPGGAGTITNLASSSMSALGISQTATASSSAYTFFSAGEYSVRACADLPPQSSGVIVESNSEVNYEQNNCGPWVNVTVVSPGAPIVSLTSNPISGLVNVVAPQLTWSATSDPKSCIFSGDWTNTNGDAVSGTNVSQGVLTQVKTYSYTLTCSNNAGTSAPASVSVDALATAMSGVINATDCVIATGNSSCNTSLTWNTINPISVSAVTTPTNITVATGNSGSATYSVAGGSPVGTRYFYLYNNGQLLSQAMASTSCAVGSVWNSATGKCEVSSSMSGTLAATNCVVDEGESNCNTSLTWSTTNPVAISAVTSSYPSANTVVYNGNAGNNLPALVPYSSRTFYLYNNSIELSPPGGVTAFASCASGTGWDTFSQTCEAGILACSLSATPSSGDAPLSTELSAVGLGGSGSYPLFEYNCDPGDPYSRFINSCLFSTPGNYVAGARVTDSKGVTTTCSAPVVVTEVGALVPGVCSSPQKHFTCFQGTPGNFKTNPSKWTWTCFGSDDGVDTDDVLCSEKNGPDIIEN